MLRDSNILARFQSPLWGVAITSTGCLFLDLLFWSTVDFGTFMPPSAGPWQERAFFAAVTALGPISMTFIKALRPSGLVACALIVTAIAAAMRWKNVGLVQLVVQIAVLLWWFLGFGVAAIRIT
jgi:hypothetical protein